jgi:hypothetical protein
MKFIYASCTLYAYSLQVSLYNILNDFGHETKLHGVRFSTCGISLLFKKIPFLKHLEILDPGCSTITEAL